MKIIAKAVGAAKKLHAWTTEREPDVAISIVVPFRNEDGELTDIEIGIDRASLLRAVKAGALNAIA